MTSFSTPTWPMDAEELRALKQGERFICLFSGGKDSGLALLKAMDAGEPLALVQCVSSASQRSWYHQQPTAVAREQALALGIPLCVSQATPWEQPSEMMALYRAYAAEGAQSVVFGDLYLEQNAAWQAALCQQAGLRPRMPLWQLDPESLLAQMQARAMESIITWVDPQRLPPYWVGHFYDDAAFRAFRQAGIDPLGEKGEFHTTLVNCDRFSHAIDTALIRF